MASWIDQGARKLKDNEGVNGTYILSARQASVTRIKLKFIQAENIRAKERRVFQRTSWGRATSFPDVGRNISLKVSSAPSVLPLPKFRIA
jgi:hypothetical protein